MTREINISTINIIPYIIPCSWVRLCRGARLTSGGNKRVFPDQNPFTVTTPLPTLMELLIYYVVR